jgi:hypothetical protein
MLAALLLCASHAFAAPALPPVYLYHDEQFACYGYLDAPKAVTYPPDRYWPVTPGDATAVGAYHRELMAALGWSLRRQGARAQVLDAAGWRDLCERGDRAVVVVIGSTIPDVVFAGQPDGSPLDRWLKGGGGMVYSGDWPFYWHCNAAGANSAEGGASQGDDAVFGADLVRDGFDGQTTKPTPLGARWLPSLRDTWTLRPFDLEAVRRACRWSEVYGSGERTVNGTRQTAADSLCFRVPGGEGLFAAFHLTRGQHTDTAQVILEFLSGRLPALLGGEAR